MINNIYYAYDVVVNDNYELSIVKYKIVDENRKNKNGKIETIRKYEEYDVEIPENIEVRIKELINSGLMPITQFKRDSFDLELSNPLINAKLLILSLNHRLIEKFYKLNNEFGNMSITNGITYFNMLNGKISTMKIATYNPANEITIRMLEDKGYIPMENSFYNNYQNNSKITR